ncbi:MAG: hypothetical protein U5O39_00590 [Gammaproteobacteria bacterium]|nr:hypothetical protein [Gammaproteobacteria bacterium]
MPDDADTRWRQEQTEYWINKAIENQRLGKDTVIGGGAVYGEILACPSINQIDHLDVCLLDCDDIVRLDRLRKYRGHEPGMDILTWAAWLRVHAVDPTWCQHVIMNDSFASMRWDNWRDWERGDPRWQQKIIDTSTAKIEQITADVARWIEAQVSTKDVCSGESDRDDMDSMFRDDDA